MDLCIRNLVSDLEKGVKIKKKVELNDLDTIADTIVHVYQVII